MPRPNYIFIDYENVPHAVLERIEGKPVTVVIVLGRQQKTLPLPLVKTIQKCAHQVRLLQTELHGKNALDFVLAAELGAAAERDPKGYFHIVSKDQGFDALVTHLNTNGVLAARCASLEEIRVLMNSKERIAYVSERLKATPSTLPKKRRTLESHIGAFFGKTLSPEEVQEVVDALIVAKQIAISEAGAVRHLV